MVFHTSLADVPPTPKEPPPPDEDEIVPDVLSFGALPDFVKVSSQTLLIGLSFFLNGADGEFLVVGSAGTVLLLYQSQTNHAPCWAGT